MKKGALLSIFTIIFSCTIFGVASASSIDINDCSNQIVFERQEILDKDTLFNRAVNGQSDIPIQSLKEEGLTYKYILTSQDGNTEEIEPLVTSQLLKSERLHDGTIKDTIAINSFVGLDQNMRTLYSQNAELHDGSISVLAYSTIYYDRIRTSSDVYAYLLTKVTGGWDIQVGSIYLTDRKVKYGMTASSVSGSPVNLTTTKYPGDFTYSYNTGYDDYIVPDTFFGVFGSTSWTTINRGGSSWELILVNNIL